jgi:hypothetical protein
MSTTLPTFIYYSKGKLRLLLFVSIVFDLGGIFCTTINPNGPWSLTPHLLTKYTFMGLLALAFGLYLGYAMIKKLWDNEPVIIIDNEGIKLRQGRIIPWEDVERVEIQKFTHSDKDNSYTDRYVVPVLKDPDKYYSESSKKLAARIGGQRTDAPVQFSTTNLNCSTDELLSILQEKFEDYISREKVKG